MRLSYLLIILGLVVMLAGAATASSGASVNVGSVGISGISPSGAALIGVGAVIFLAGIGLYAKRK